MLQKNHKQSFFVTFEGAEAVGKSSLISLVTKNLLVQNIDVITTREPGGTVIAEKIREVIFGDNINAPSSQTELLLMFAARRDHIEKIIHPNLEAGKIVLCDRFIDSSYVYQSDIAGIDKIIIDKLVELFVYPTLPALCFVIDCDAQTSYQRILKRGAENRNDLRGIEYFESLRASFLNRVKTNAQYPYIIVENYDIEQSSNKIISEILKFKQSIQ